MSGLGKCFEYLTLSLHEGEGDARSLPSLIEFRPRVNLRRLFRIQSQKYADVPLPGVACAQLKYAILRCQS
jgi:hypothetical protein